MKTVAVICEYNPFHNGHAHQLRQMAAVGTTVCVMSGSYVQRGEPAGTARVYRNGILYGEYPLQFGSDLPLPESKSCRSCARF